MKGFVHIRIDDRLIHGQVATRWSTGLKVNRIMVIDDAVAANDNEKAILRMAASTHPFCPLRRQWPISRTVIMTGRGSC